MHTGSKHVVNSTTTYDKIHQISFVRRSDDGYFIACSAGRELLFVTIAGNKFKSSSVVKLCDWISSVKVLEDETTAIITAHNLATFITFKKEETVIEGTLRCEENSTLYCSHISGSSKADLTFFSATALGELIVWRKIKEQSKVILRKYLHNGVIFSIDYNEKYLVSR